MTKDPEDAPVLVGINTQRGHIIPAAPGSYALIFRIDDTVRVDVGRLGGLTFTSGIYLYLGSALGPGGLRARLRHHFNDAGKPHWHIDSLRALSKLQGGWYCASPVRMECTWSQALAALPGAKIPAPGFGATDCKRGCRSHLVAFPRSLDETAVEQTLRSTLPAGETYLLARF